MLILEILREGAPARALLQKEDEEKGKIYFYIKNRNTRIQRNEACQPQSAAASSTRKKANFAARPQSAHVQLLRRRNQNHWASAQVLLAATPKRRRGLVLLRAHLYKHPGILTKWPADWRQSSRHITVPLSFSGDQRQHPTTSKYFGCSCITCVFFVFRAEFLKSYISQTSGMLSMLQRLLQSRSIRNYMNLSYSTIWTTWNAYNATTAEKYHTAKKNKRLLVHLNSSLHQHFYNASIL